LQHEHDFDWNNTEILDEEEVYNKRLISEMLNIKKQKNSLNLQINTESLNLQTNTEGLHKSHILVITKI